MDSTDLQCYHSGQVLRVDHDVAGYVLAGGRSSRMGTDKAMLTVDGKPLLQLVAEAVRDAIGTVTIVGNAGRHSGFGAPVIADKFPGQGPLAGIHAALQHTVNHTLSEWNLIVACDMPGVTAKMLGDLIRIRTLYTGADVVLPFASNRPQPLCALYRRRLLPSIESALIRGNLKIMHVLESARIAQIDFPDERMFRNVNTPEDWRELQNQPS